MYDPNDDLGLDSDDFDDEEESDEDEEAPEVAEIPKSAPQVEYRQPRPSLSQPTRPIAVQKGRQIRIRRMPPRMVQNNPSVISVLMTKSDGRQILLVRK